MTGNSSMDAKGKSFTMKSKIIIDANYLLKCDSGYDEAFNERRVVIPFGNYLPAEKRNLKMDKELSI
ncbi:MAG: hypothetical protein LBR26_10910 [Prevotella sp.]|nr:hypothetical protein [Prevotella sp.]